MNTNRSAGRLISRIEADAMLKTKGLIIGSWGEFREADSSCFGVRSFAPSRDARELLYLSRDIVSWLGPGAWVLYQVDNSTCPLDLENLVFDRIVLDLQCHWDIAEVRSFLFGFADEAGEKNSMDLILLIGYSIAFEWHVHLVSEATSAGQRVAIQDGVIHFYGDQKVLSEADRMIPANSGVGS